nr:hypothetical protein [Acidisoma sp. S159]
MSDVPPDTTISVPPLKIVALLSVPPNDTISTPPLLTSVADAVPPARTVSVAPLVRISPLLTMPLPTEEFGININLKNGNAIWNSEGKLRST